MTTPASAPGHWSQGPDLSQISIDGLHLTRASNPEEVAAAQRLRYRVFYGERGAHPIGDMAVLQRDYDVFDQVADHLLVVDPSQPAGEQVVGTYRLLLEEKARAAGTGLYTDTRFDLTRLRSTGKRILELSRSCVADAYRKRVTINLLWNGIAAYFYHFHIDYMVGVASFHGNDPAEHELSLAYLNQSFLLDEALRPQVIAEDRIALPKRDLSPAEQRQAYRALPPLIRGYLRMGARIGQGAQIDRQFNTIVICMVFSPMEAADRYHRHYQRVEEVVRS